MKGLLTRLWREETGQDLIEYGLLLVLLALVASAAISAIGQTASAVFSNANTSLT